MDLKEMAKGMNAGKGIEFMEGRNKGEAEELLDRTVTIRNFDFINGENGEYAVFIIDEDEENFYFAGSVLTDNLKQLVPAKEQIISEGLPTKFTQRKSKAKIVTNNNSKKAKRNYTAVEFYPED